MWIFERSERKALKVSLIDHAKESRKHDAFVGHLFKVKDHGFLDLVADKLDLAAD